MYSLVAATLLALQVPEAMPTAEGTSPPSGYSHAPSPLSPDSVLDVPDGPLLILKRTPGSPIVALRVSVPRPTTASGAHWSSVSRILIAQAQERTAGAVRLTGAHLVVSETPDRIGYQVLGSRFDFETLAWILRLALAPPSEEGFRSGLERERERRDRLAETPRGNLETRMRGASSDQPASWEEFQQVWARTHQPDSTRVLAIGDLTIPTMMAAFRGVRTHDIRPGRFAAWTGEPVEGRLQRLLEWRAQWGSLGHPNSPATATAAEVLRRRIERIAPGEATLEVVSSEDGQDLRVGILVTARRRSLTRLVMEAVTDGIKSPITEAEVQAARAAVLARLHRKLADPLGWLEETDSRLKGSTGVERNLETLSVIEPEDIQHAIDTFLASAETMEVGR